MTVTAQRDDTAATLRRLLDDPSPTAGERLLARLQPLLTERYPDTSVRVELNGNIGRYLRFLADQGASRVHPGDTFLAYVQDVSRANKPASVSNLVSAARIFYRVLKDAGALDAHIDPTGGYRHQTRTSPPKAPYPETDIHAILAASSDYTAAAVLCGAHAGLIGQALIALTWEDIDYERGALLTLKGEVPLSPELQRALERHSGPYGGRFASGRVFPRHKDDMALRRLLWQACRDARVTYRTWQALHTTYALRVLREVPDTDTRMQRLFLDTERALERYVALL